MDGKVPRAATAGGVRGVAGSTTAGGVAESTAAEVETSSNQAATAPEEADRAARNEPSALSAPSPDEAAGPSRRVKLTLSRVDPFSVLKVSFLLSVALAVAGVVAVAVLWVMLNGLGVFSTVTDSVNELQSGATASSRVDVGDWFGFGRIVALAVVFGTLDIVLLTALATLAAIIYNLCATLIGGVQVTLTDD
ncbi:MAG: DUF3566 domain-containing protein [Dermatophilaceae bacterium]